MAELTAVHLPLERVYTLPVSDPFRLVHSTVEYVLGLSLPETRAIERTRPTVVYHLWHGYPFAHIALLDVTERTTLLRAHLLRPRDPIQVIHWRNAPETLHALDMLEQFIALVDREIGSVLGQVTITEGYTPPPPHANTPEDSLAWQTLYHPDMPIKDLAEITSLSPQTLYNTRSHQYAQGAPKKTRRGRKPKNQ